MLSKNSFVTSTQSSKKNFASIPEVTCACPFLITTPTPVISILTFDVIAPPLPLILSPLFAALTTTVQLCSVFTFTSHMNDVLTYTESCRFFHSALLVNHPPDCCISFISTTYPARARDLSVRVVWD